jgi:acyl-CoA synthetase (AMP-forming)/AMP-acid ligase II
MMSFDVTTLHGRRAEHRANRMAVGDILERLTWSRPHQEALVGRPGAYADPAFARLTYAQADALANQTANALLGAGLARGDRVLLFCDNSVEAIVLLLAVAKAGLVAAPVNPVMAPDVVAWIAGHVEPAFCVVDAGLAERAQPALTSAGIAPDVAIAVGGEPPDGVPGFSEWIAPWPADEPEVAIAADDIWEVLFTSGTTAMPKASMSSHTFSYLTGYSYALSLTRGVAHEHDFRMGTFLPIVYHCGHNSTIVPAWLSGGTAIIGRGPSRYGELAAAITEDRITGLWAGSPQFLEGLVSTAEAEPDVYDLRSLTVAMFSWKTIHADLADRLRALAGEDVQIWEIYGQTESMSGYRFWMDEHPERVRAGQSAVNYVGVPNPIMESKILDEEGRDLRDRPGVPGEAVFRGPALTSGYFRNQEATEEAFAGGWFHSGDSCCYEPDGVQVLVDRFKDIVKSGGENVSSLRVESVAIQCPGVEKVAVIGIPDERWGERVTAVVVSDRTGPYFEQEIIAFCRSRLAGYETPKRVVFVPELPETVGGKVLKYRLRELLADANAR